VEPLGLASRWKHGGALAGVRVTDVVCVVMGYIVLDMGEKCNAQMQRLRNRA